MITVNELVSRCERLSSASGKTLSTLSARIFGDGTRLTALKAGKDMGARRIEAALPTLRDLESQYADELAALADAAATDRAVS